MSLSEWESFASLADSTTRPLAIPPAIASVPQYITTSIPTDLGAGAESVIGAGNFADRFIGIR